MFKLAKYVVLDMGGTLNKVCFLSSTHETVIPHVPELTGTDLTNPVDLKDFSLYFRVFDQIADCFKYLNTYFKHTEEYDTIAVTGGGAFKYREQLEQLGKKIVNVK